MIVCQNAYESSAIRSLGSSRELLLVPVMRLCPPLSGSLGDDGIVVQLGVGGKVVRLRQHTHIKQS